MTPPLNDTAIDGSRTSEVVMGSTARPNLTRRDALAVLLAGFPFLRSERGPTGHVLRRLA